MTNQREKAEQFLALHQPGTPLLLPNPWDRGSAKVLASLGFAALATTSGGFAVSQGGLDGTLTRDQAIAHSADIVAAVDVPVSADLENAFADEPEGVAETIRLAIETGLAGGSIEDYSGRDDEPLYPLELAADRVLAAAEAAHGGPVPFVLTARAENFLRGHPDLDDTIARLQAFQEAGADVLYAPRLRDLDDIRRVVDSVDLPVNVLLVPGGPSVAELSAVGVARLSVGGSFNLAAYGALVGAARELLAGGELTFWDLVGEGRTAVQAAMAD